jgi:O-antigen ligase
MAKINKICDSVIEYSFYLLFFLVPLIMTPWNYELFEFNKMLTVYFFTAIIVFAWCLKMILNKRFLFQRTFWDIPLVVFFFSQLLSFTVSIDRHTSFWGYYSRFNGGLASILAFLLLYWALVSNLDRKKTFNLLFFTLGSAVLVTSYAVLEHFGIDAQYWVQDVQSRVFSTIGQPNWLAAWIIILIPLTWALMINQWKLKKRLKFLLPSFLSLLFLLSFIFTKSRSGLLGLGSAWLVFWGALFWFKRFEFKKFLKPFLFLTGALIVLNLLLPSPWQLKFLNSKENPAAEETAEVIPTGGTESGEIRKIVWKGAFLIWQHHPFLGTGPETFAYSYYWYRPREHNDVSEWDFLYNKAHNEYLNYAANTGTLGLLSYLFLSASFFFWVSKKKKIESQDLNLKLALTAGFVSLLVTNFFGFAVVPVSLLFFTIPGLAFCLSKTEEKIKMERLLKLNWLWLGLLLVLVVGFLWTLLSLNRWWQADKNFASGEKLNKAGETNQAFSLLQKAVDLRPYEPFYYDELSLVSGSLAVAAAKQEQATLAAQLTDLAIASSDYSLKVSPYNLNFWKNRTRLFYSLAQSDEKYNQQALEALLMANKLAPTDPKIMYNLALVYGRLNQQETAIKTLEEAVELKPNYDHVRYALALFYEEKGEIDKAREQLEYILEKITPNYQSAIEKLEKLK